MTSRADKTTDNFTEVLRPVTGNTFNFNCHKDIACFTKCCAKLHLVLTPYDILRMKNRLGVSSDDFLDRYTDIDMKTHHRFPMIRLKMGDNAQRTCPFVTKEGCRIYEDRPGACRLYPIARASRLIHGKNETTEKFFFVNEAHCLGFNENKKWTLKEWMANEGVDEYNSMNDHWLEIISSPKSLGSRESIDKKRQMFFMASYNMDRFREFVFQSRFFDRIHVTPDQKVKLKTDDLALMSFAMDWLKFSLFGEQTMDIKKKSGRT